MQYGFLSLIDVLFAICVFTVYYQKLIQVIKKQTGINTCIIQANTPVQVRPGNTASLSYGPDYFPLFYYLAWFYISLHHMTVHGYQSLSVIDED